MRQAFCVEGKRPTGYRSSREEGTELGGQWQSEVYTAEVRSGVYATLVQGQMKKILPVSVCLFERWEGGGFFQMAKRTLAALPCTSQ